MMAHTGFLYLFASIALGGAHASAVARGGAATEDKNPALTATPVFRANTAAAARGSADAPHLFPVNDERGLLLTCIAPEIEINRETDLFHDCSLAPGRTLDDVMHTFVRALHYEQHRQQSKDNAGSRTGSEQDTAQQAH